jgi:hypothetical protein
MCNICCGVLDYGTVLRYGTHLFSTRRYNPEHHNINLYRLQNLRSDVIIYEYDVT